MTTLRTANMLGALATAVAGQLEERLRRHPNETDTSAAALNLIGLFEGCSNGELSRGLKLSHAATVRLVDKLEAGRLVESRPGSDRRAVSLRLTEAGRERVRHVLEERCAALDGVVDVLTPEQRVQLDGIAETLLRSLVSSPFEAGHICRLCDEMVCPPERCPVHLEAAALMAAG